MNFRQALDYAITELQYQLDGEGSNPTDPKVRAAHEECMRVLSPIANDLAAHLAGEQWELTDDGGFRKVEP